VYGEQQAVDRKDALRLLTIEAAFFIAEEKMLGSIEKGKYADLVVLNGDYMTVPENEIEKLEPMMTIVGGQVAFEAPPAR
jgi:predicted amidohydrolase YtcJ